MRTEEEIRRDSYENSRVGSDSFLDRVYRAATAQLAVSARQEVFRS